MGKPASRPNTDLLTPDPALPFSLLRQQFNLPEQKTLLIQKLVIIRPALQKARQEPQQPPSVLHQYPPHLVALIWIRDKHFEHMKRFVLHHLPVVFEQVHGEFEIIATSDVGGHDNVVGTVKQQFA